MNFLPYLQLQWWVYIVVVFTFFFVVLLLNYVVKKINEARIDDRFNKLHNRASTTRSVQVQRPIETPSLPSRKPLEIVIEQSNPPTLRGISMVFGQVDKPAEDRMKVQTETKKNSVTDLGEVPAENTDRTNATDDKDEAVSNAPCIHTIYKELSFIDTSKSLSDSVGDDVQIELDTKDASTIQQIKSAPHNS